MRILVVSNLYPPRVLGGYELAADKLSRALRGRGHEVLVLTSQAWAAPEPGSGPVDHERRALALAAYRTVTSSSPSVSVERDYASKVSQLDNTLVLLDTIRQWRPDHVLLFNLIGIGGLALLDAVDAMGIPRTLNLGDRVPTVLLEQIDPSVSALYAADDGSLFRRGRVCAVSRGLVDEIRRGGIDLGDVTIIPRGILPHDIARRREYRAGGATRFTAASVLTAFKGIGVIVEAAAQLRNQGIGPFRVDIFGDGAEREHFEQQARDAGVDDIVHFRGFIGQDELLKEHAAADAFLFPTWSREPGASVPFEAASVGCVPIVTRDCGPAEQLSDGIDALLIDNTADSLAAAMIRVCRGEVDLEAIGAAGRALVQGRLSFETSVRRLEELMFSAAPVDGMAEGTTDPVDRASAAVARAIELDTEVATRLDGLIVAAERAHVDAAVGGAIAARAPYPKDGGARFRRVLLRAIAPLLWRLDRIAEGVDQIDRDGSKASDVGRDPAWRYRDALIVAGLDAVPASSVVVVVGDSSAPDVVRVIRSLGHRPIVVDALAVDAVDDLARSAAALVVVGTGELGRLWSAIGESSVSIDAPLMIVGLALGIDDQAPDAALAEVIDRFGWTEAVAARLVSDSITRQLFGSEGASRRVLIASITK